MCSESVARVGLRAMRSQLVIGAATVVTASAMAATGAGASVNNLPALQTSAPHQVKLAAFANPFLEVFDTISKANLYLFSIAEPPTTKFDRAGIIPDFLAAGFPILTQHFLNAPDYVNQSLNYLFQDFGGTKPIGPYPGALRVLAWAVDALPGNLVYATQQLFSGNLVGALDTLQFAIANPIQAALYQTLNAGLYVLGGVTVRAAAVATEFAEWLPETIKNLADDVTVVMNAAARVVRNVAYGVQTLNLETVWNSLVVGLLGTDPNPATPTIPDALINQTIGEGGRIYTVPGSPSYREIPSIRENIADLRDAIADALATDVPIPEEPPYPVSPPPFQSQIPTPWNPTPAPVAAPASTTASLATHGSVASLLAGGVEAATAGIETAPRITADDAQDASALPDVPNEARQGVRDSSNPGDSPTESAAKISVKAGDVPGSKSSSRGVGARLKTQR